MRHRDDEDFLSLEGPKVQVGSRMELFYRMKNTFSLKTQL